MIIQELTEEDEVELFDSATQILEDAAKNKVPVDKKFKRFLEAEEARSRHNQKRKFNL